MKPRTRFAALFALGLSLTACGDTPVEPVRETDFRTPVDLTAATYGGGRFVAVGAFSAVALHGDVPGLVPGSDSSVIVWSADGIRWTRAELDERDGSLLDVAYGNGAFVAVGSELWERGRPRLLRSSDGERWAAVLDGPELEWRSIAFGNGVFLALGIHPQNRGTVIARSVDGLRWEVVAETDRFGVRLMFGHDTFVVFGEMSGVATSADGVEWTDRFIPSIVQIDALAYLDGRFVGSATHDCCYGEVPDAIRYFTILSDDGLAWRAVNRTERLFFTSQAFGRQLYVSAGPRGVYTAPGGLSGWTMALAPETLRAPYGDSEDWFSAVLFAADRFVTVGRRNIFTSSDGRGWQRIPIPD